MAQPPVLLTDEEFREAAKRDAVPAEAQLRRAFIAEVRASDPAADDRTLDFVISTAAVDRMGDTIAVEGWKLANYRKNPVVLWGHDPSMLPVAKASNIRVEDGKLMARAEFMPREISGFADAVYRSLLGGFLSATSVGFVPVKYAFSEDAGRRFGIDFIEQELLEFSIVCVPANPEALQNGKSALAPESPLRSWVDQAAKDAGLTMLPTKHLDAIQALPGLFREMADKLPAKANGARGQILRCANFAERQINLAPPHGEEEPPEPRHAADEASMQRLEMARRRLALLSARA